MNKKFAILSALALSLPGLMCAQKIAMMDREGVLAATSDGKAALKTIDDKFGPRKQAFDKMNADLQAKQTAWSKASATAKPALETEITALTNQIKTESADAQQDMQEEQQRLFGPILQKMQKILDQYAAANQIAIVVDSSATPNNLLYAEKSTNISEAIVAAYNKEAAAEAPASAAPAAKPPAAPPARQPAARPPAASGTKPAAPGK